VLPPLIPRRVLFGNPTHTGPAFSHDGRYLAYLAPDDRNVLQVWLRDLTSSAQPARPVTHAPKRGMSVEYILYSEEGHGFARPDNRLHFMARAERFLATYLGGRAEPEDDVPGHSGTVM
jgi:hypothetical protein